MTQIIIYATCQGGGIRHYLSYYLPNSNITVIRNYQLILNKSPIDNSLLERTNIFIYQEIPVKWGIYSTDISVENNILSYLPQDCIKIKIPYVFADWYWGLGRTLLRDMTYNCDHINNETETHIKYYNKDIILDMKHTNRSLDDILTAYDSGDINFKYQERMEQGIKILKQKESTCDIKVSEFILKHYKSHRLFLAPNHPTYIILIEMTKQILDKLRIDYADSDFDGYTKYNLAHDWIFSKYDIQYHRFEFQQEVNDDYIKQLIVDIYNSF